MSDFATLVLKLQNMDFNAQLQKSSMMLKNFAGGVTKVGVALSAISVPISLFGKNAIKAASDAEEVGSKFDAVFKDVAKVAEESARSIADSFGLANSTSEELLANTGDLLSGFGFTGKEALNLSERVNKLAIDLASFSNFSGGASGASQSLTKALLGETESAKSLGIVIRQNTKEFREQVKQLMQQRNLTETQAKALLILDQAYAQSKNAIGDYARTQNSTANAMRRFNEQMKELQESIGKLLIESLKIGDLISDFGNIIKSVTQNINQLSPSMKKILAVSSLILVAIGPLTLALGGVIWSLGALLPVLPAIIANVGVLATTFKFFQGIVQQFDNRFDLVKTFKDMSAWIAETTGMIDLMNISLKDLAFWGKSIGAILEGAGMIFAETFISAGQILGQFIQDNVKLFSRYFEWLSTNWNNLWSNLANVVFAIAKDIGNVFSGLGKNIMKALTGQDTDFTRVFADLGRNLGMALKDAKITELELLNPLSNVQKGLDEYKKRVNDINEKVGNKLSNIIQEDVSSSFENAIKKGKKVLDEATGKDSSGTGIGTSGTPSSKTAQALLAGTAEAQKVAIGTTVDSNKRTADNTTEIAKNTKDQTKMMGDLVSNTAIFANSEIVDI